MIGIFSYLRKICKTTKRIVLNMYFCCCLSQSWWLVNSSQQNITNFIYLFIFFCPTLFFHYNFSVWRPTLRFPQRKILLPFFPLDQKLTNPLYIIPGWFVILRMKEKPPQNIPLLLAQVACDGKDETKSLVTLYSWTDGCECHSDSSDNPKCCKDVSECGQSGRWTEDTATLKDTKMRKVSQSRCHFLSQRP